MNAVDVAADVAVFGAAGAAGAAGDAGAVVDGNADADAFAAIIDCAVVVAIFCFVSLDFSISIR